MAMTAEQQASYLRAALRDLYVIHFPYRDPRNDPKADRRELQIRMMWALQGEPYYRDWWFVDDDSAWNEPTADGRG